MNDELSTCTQYPIYGVIEWHRYDGTPETLPTEDIPLCCSRADNGYATLFEGVWVDNFDSYIGNPNVGDLWAYIPKPPTLDENENVNNSMEERMNRLSKRITDNQYDIIQLLSFLKKKFNDHPLLSEMMKEMLYRD